ncbi:hypothetical protein LEP1GSC041_2678 [Leptospira noguchii str. 2006001870]|uniref:Uncharacterized protein n=1 Tax=Leptospira noguchii serovar Autumnalis str. ZUN142 TaxID=1085540 RepID=M6UEJ1_9LEPT|nr:hypothetical protein LEP1GSC041_2678 [Leptospira noguchii str. 2006001870]EMO41251.1 hypothetical protein LEP1GSC186_3036 [Leptospira noguchii serovar Autumnalis str. ZUN142]
MLEFRHGIEIRMMGHTLKDAINQMEKIVGIRPKDVYVLNHS